MTVTIQLSPDAATILRGLATLPARMLRAVASAHDKENQLTIGHIQERRMNANRFSPPRPPEEGVLRSITARLKRSLNAEPAAVTETAVVSSIGSNVRYAGAHEFGFSGQQNVGPHLRRRFVTAKFMGAGLTKSGKPRTVTRRIQSGDVSVRAFTRRMNIPARAPIRRGIEDRLANYSSAISAAIVETNPIRGN